MEVCREQVVEKDGVQYYHFRIVAGGHSHAFGQRFSEFHKIHKKLQAADCPVPCFPSKHIFGSVEPTERSKELATWILGCLRSSSILIHPVFHQLFHFRPQMISEFKNIVNQRRERGSSPQQQRNTPSTPKHLSGVSSRFSFSPRDVIGQGGYGKTYIGTDTQAASESAAKVVVKEFSPQHAGAGRNLSEADKDMFRKEANQLQLLGDHPKIPKLLGYFETATSLFLVQELVHGSDLNKLVHARGVFGEPSVWKLMVQVLFVLKYCHDSRNPAGGVVHRDIKPSNIMKRASDGDIPAQGLPPLTVSLVQANTY